MFEKIMPRMFVYAYDPERIEEMLDRKSREGWQCYEVGLFYCFHRGEPDEYEYRVQATKKKEMERLQYIKGLRELGIEHVGTVGEYLILRKKKDGTPFELYSDLDSLMAQIKRVRRVLWSGAVMCPFIAFAADRQAVSALSDRRLCRARNIYTGHRVDGAAFDRTLHLRRAVYPRIVPNERKAQKARSRARDSGVTRILQNAAARCRIALLKNKQAGGKPT